MNITQQAQSFSAGCDLWVCPTYDSSPSRWAASIDWQLNFAHSKQGSHEKAEMNLNLQKILSKTALPQASLQFDTDFTLIPAEGHLPTKWIVFFNPPEQPQAAFLQKLLKKAEGLNAQSIRVFLPAQWSTEKIQKLNPDSRFQFVKTSP